jgi:hypothetical protein
LAAAVSALRCSRDTVEPLGVADFDTGAPP